MADIKWSAFPTVSTPGSGDVLVGLHAGANYQFTGLTVPFSLSVGGTGASLTPSVGGIVYSGLSSLAILAGTSTANQVLLSGSSAAPAWSTATYPATITANELLYSSGANIISGLTGANNGVLVTGNTGIPAWLANSVTPGYVLTANNASPPSWQAISGAGAITTINGDSGSAVPSAGAITITGVGIGLSTSGSGSTLTIGGTLSLAHGGTNANLTASNGGIFYSTASAGAILSGTASANKPLLSGSSTAPTWATVTYPTSVLAGSVLIGSSSNTIGSTSNGVSSVLVSNSSGVPQWINGGTGLTDGQVVIGSTGSTPVGAALTAGSGISITNGAGSITIATTGSGTVNSGTAQQVAYYATTGSAVSGITVSNNSALIANGSGNLASLGYSTTATASNLVERDANANIFCNNEAAGQAAITAGGATVLTAASARTQIVSGSGASTIQLPNATTLVVGWTFYINNNTASTVTILANDGVTTVASMPGGQYLQIYNSSIATSNGIWDYHWLVPTNMANGQVMIGSTTSGPKAANLTAGTGISITNAANSITIASTAGGIAWSTVSGTTQAASVDSGYIIGNASQTTVTLPATAAIGSTVAVCGGGAGGWILAANTGQTIRIGSSQTASAGNLTSAAQYDNVTVVCVVANTTWMVQSVISTGLTVN